MNISLTRADEISECQISESEKTAALFFDNCIKAQSLVKVIDQDFPSQGKIINIESNSKDSFIIENLSKKLIKIYGRFNHLTIRNCKNVAVMMDSCISGVDIIKCTSVSMNISDLNFLEVYSSSNIKIESKSFERMIFDKCLDCWYNRVNVRCSPFDKKIYTNGDSGLNVEEIQLSDLVVQTKI